MGSAITDNTYLGRFGGRAKEIVKNALEICSEDDFCDLAKEVGGFTSNGIHRTWTNSKTVKYSLREWLNSSENGHGVQLWGAEAFRYAAEGILMAEIAGCKYTIEKLRNDLEKIKKQETKPESISSILAKVSNRVR